MIATPEMRGAMKTTDQRKIKRRNQIVRAATIVFAEVGYHEASISDIIDRAGIARGTFYLYFDGKHSIFDSILGNALRGLKECIKPIDISPGATSPDLQLRQNVVRIFEFVDQHASLMRLLINPGLSPTDDANNKIDSFHTMVRKLVESSLTHGIQLNWVEPCDIEMVAAAAVGAMRGVIHHYIEAEPPIEVQTATDNVLRFALSGVLAGKNPQ